MAHGVALAIRKTALGEKHLATARSRMSIGLLLRRQKRPSLALVECGKALAVRQKALRDGHQDVAADVAKSGTAVDVLLAEINGATRSNRTSPGRVIGGSTRSSYHPQPWPILRLLLRGSTGGNCPAHRAGT